jgi:hypothetical protein
MMSDTRIETSSPVLARVRSWWVRYAPRPETILLFCALIIITLAKLSVLRGRVRVDPITTVGQIVLADVAFLFAVYALFRLAYLVLPEGIVSRAAVIAALLLVMWSAADAVWLTAVGAPLNMDLLIQMLRDAQDCWPILESRLSSHRAGMAAGGVMSVILLVWVTYGFLYPRPLRKGKNALLTRIGVSSALALLAVLGQRAIPTQARLGYHGALLGPSSHLRALQTLFSGGASEYDADTTDDRISES